MTAVNHSYPEENWICGTEYDDLPLLQISVDRVLERMVNKWVDGDDKDETIFEFNNHIMINAPLLYDRVTYKQIVDAFDKKNNNKCPS